MNFINPNTSTCDLEDAGIPLGMDLATGDEVFLNLELLKTHLHVIGPTGTGKTRALLHLFRYLAQVPKATIVLIDPKGGLYELARDHAMTHGLTKRLVLFDPQAQNVVCGYNPLFPNALPLGSHAKLVREGIEAAWGQSSMDFALTPQLHRFLYLTLFAARELELTLVEALDLLRPGSAVRKAILPRLRDPHVKNALIYFDSLQERRQEELAASTTARLEAFCLDPQVRRIFTTRQKALNLEEVIGNGQILLVNLSKGRPLRRDDVHLIARLLVNDVVNHVFERGPGRRTPVFLLIDECQNAATPDLCDALDEGRELGLHCVLAHQFLAQIKEEERSGYLYHSVMNDCRTRIVFGGSAPEDLEMLVPRMFLDRLNPWALKDEIKVPIFAPVESTRIVRTTGRSRSHGRGLALPYAEAEGESDTATYGITESASHGTSESDSKAVTKG
ncbi:MAG TPA: DUF87 domain-containing protein, partial [Candidatus Binatia bacterium]|nr:DUF87 domain-containing protein [Candidatus Binatia bacterium]